MYLIFDTETTGLPKNWNAPITDTDNWPRCVQIAWQLHDRYGKIIDHQNYLITPDGFDIPYDSEQIHGISTDLATEQGIEIVESLQKFNHAIAKSKFIVGQNITFDLNIMGCEFHRYKIATKLQTLPILDTCTENTANLCKIPGGRRGKFKLPTLTELHLFLFDTPFEEAHNATADVEATTRCFFELIRIKEFSIKELNEEDDFFEKFIALNPNTIQSIGLSHQNLKKESEKLKNKKTKKKNKIDKSLGIDSLKNVSFSHLHNHSQFSILQSTTTIKSLVKATANNNMSAVAITDQGNLMGAFQFVREINNHNKEIRTKKENSTFHQKEIIPIVGCELFICEDHTNKKIKDNGFQIVALAKNKEGYHNLAKLSSIGYTKGFYYVPRIDKELLKQHKENLIITSGNLNGEIPYKILNVGEKQAEESLVWYKEQFGDDFYLEIMRHNQENEERVNEVLLKFSKKHNIKCVATNNTYYISKENAKSQDILLCIKDGELVDTPIGRGRGFRFGFPNHEYYFKSQEEMKNLFYDIPEAIINIQEIIDKIECYDLARDVLLPEFNIPEEFQDKNDLKDNGKRGENNYLRHLTYLGAKERYGEITKEIEERLDFELKTISNTGYPGYFLIVQDFCKAARKMKVSVGPGRGSAAGSAVAYCTGITNVDPIKYNLLFERFLNPDRISMPDIDIDFDDEGRGKVIEWVINKYGSNQVAQIITYGTMAAKSSIRDTARVLDLPLFEAGRIAKMIPDISLSKIFNLDEIKLSEKLKNNKNDINRANELKQISKGNDLQANVVNQAREIEGTIRNTGTHACGIIITPDDITKFVPISTAKDSEMSCTQFDNAVVEDAGLLKMDFLGLKTLTLIKDAVKIVEEIYGKTLHPDDFDLSDKKTYELFQKGETVGVFQFESPGMKKYLRDLKPTVFEDLIAMVALYRPGPIEYIPLFIKRKHGSEEIVYDLDDCKEYLEETYGITVYQEQVMLLSQKLANFSKGEADGLRKAMGKKKIDLLAKMKPKFINQGAKKGHNPKILEKIWKDWEAFASYAFNKSHATCYALVAFQTAYLKANYPAAYMASVLSNNMDNIKSITHFMEECQRMDIKVLGPDINESLSKFTINKNKDIRFGLEAIKGVGKNAVDSIINERKKNSSYKSIFDFAKRVNLRQCNKKVFESLAISGGFDSFKHLDRSQLFVEDSKGRIFIENIIKYGNTYQENKNSLQTSLFGENSGVDEIEPQIPKSKGWSSIEKLNKEKEVIGIFISGHPLDDYKLEINSYCKGNIAMLNNKEKYQNQDCYIACMVTEIEQDRITRRGKQFGTMTIEDYTDSYKLFLFQEDYLKYKMYMSVGTFLYIKGKIQHKIHYGKPSKDLIYKISSIELLNKIRETKTKFLTLSISTKDINNGILDEINRIFENHKGETNVIFNIYDHTENIEISMPSRSVKVNVSNEFVKNIEHLKVIEYKISQTKR